MKLKYIFPILFIALLNVSCSSDNDDDDSGITNEITGLTKIQDLINDTHTIELFNTTGQFKTGYNAISLRVIDNATNSYVEDANLSWIPMMQMPTMEHSSPKSTITKTLGKDTVYDGFIIYQMTNLDDSGWSLTVNYTINGIDYTVTDAITVLQNDNQNSASFMGSDDSRYIVALAEPNDPKIAINNLKVGLFKMENMMTFPVVEDFTITLDPRMPGMGNHTSPNNTDLTYNSAEQIYNADLALTMTGYWYLI